MDKAQDLLQEALDKYMSGNFEEAKELATKAMNAGSTDIAVFQIRALSAYFLKQYAQSVNDFNTYLDAVPDNREMLRNRGYALFLSGQKEEGIKDMDAFIAAHPLMSEGYYHRGYLKADLKMYNESIEDLTKAINLGFDMEQIFFKRGVIYFNTKDYEAANQDLTEAINQEPGNAEAIYMRGLARYFRKDYGGAIADFSRLIFLKPDHPYARFYRMYAYKDSGKITDAQNDADGMVNVNTLPVTFSKNGRKLPVISMEVTAERLEIGLDTTALGEEETKSRKKWQQTEGNKPRPVANANITLNLPQGGIGMLQIRVHEAKF